MKKSTAQTIQLLISIDVEPDGRDLNVPDAGLWRGQAYLNRRIEKIRKAFGKRTGRPANFVWCFRLDPQIEKSFGDLAWPLNTFADRIASLARAGDAFGVHPHSFRWDEKRQFWYTDFSDQAWIEHCVRQSLAAYEGYFGEPCRIFRFGDSWFNEATLDLIARLGIEYDLTVEPGFAADRTWRAGEAIRGEKPDTRGAPTMPWWRPEGGHRATDGAADGGLWMVPISTAPLGPDRSRASPAGRERGEASRRSQLRQHALTAPRIIAELTRIRWLAKRFDWSRTAYERLARFCSDALSEGRIRTGMQALNMALDPIHYAHIFDQALARSGHRFVHTVVRSGDLSYPRQRANFVRNVEFLLDHRDVAAFRISTPDRFSGDWQSWNPARLPGRPTWSCSGSGERFAGPVRAS